MGSQYSTLPVQTAIRGTYPRGIRKISEFEGLSVNTESESKFKLTAISEDVEYREFIDI